MIQQLRIYEIFEHNKAAFHARFRDHAARIMRRHAFDIVATRGRSRSKRRRLGQSIPMWRPSLEKVATRN
jgi:hypothetical protein